MAVTGSSVCNVGYGVADHVRRHPTGRVYTAETGFVLARNPDTVRGPDVAYLAFPRADHPIDQAGFIEGPPDLAVEVVSPNDPERYVAEKVADYHHAGTPLVWVVRPRQRTVTVHDASGDVRVLGEGEMLDGGGRAAGVCGGGGAVL